MSGDRKLTGPPRALPRLSSAVAPLGCRSFLSSSRDLCFPEALHEAPPPLLLSSPASLCQVFRSPRVLIEMAHSRDRACSQLCRPPLPGAGGRKQNPISVASTPPSTQQTQSFLSGPPGPPHGGAGGSPAWLEARVPASSALPAKKHLTSLRRPATCAEGEGPLSAKWRPGGSSGN